jgi:hypothetical protein
VRVRAAARSRLRGREVVPESVAGLDIRSLNADRFFGEMPPQEFAERASGLRRIWVVEGLTSHGNALVLRDHRLFARTASWTFPTRRLSLYERRG